MASKWGSRYAIVASTLALALALGGTAYAVATVDSADIVNGSVQSIDVHNGTLRRIDLAPNQVSRRLFAVVNADGSLVASAGVAETTHVDTGLYAVRFVQDVSACAFLASPGARNGGVSSSDRFITVNNIVDAPNWVRAQTARPGGVEDFSWNLAVVC